jgi:hypothetical protein
VAPFTGGRRFVGASVAAQRLEWRMTLGRVPVQSAGRALLRFESLEDTDPRAQIDDR